MRPVGRGGPALAATLTIATAGGLLAVSEVPASAASSCASPAYKRQFYANTTFSGTPKKTDCDATVNENWGTKAPASGLPKDNFGVRWTVTRDFGSGGPFALPVAAQDGLRVYRWNPATAAYEKTHETSAGAFVYFDTGAKRGTTSYYWVTGVKADGTETLPAGDWTVTKPAR
jgi:hypothetical protein